MTADHETEILRAKARRIVERPRDWSEEERRSAARAVLAQWGISEQLEEKAKALLGWERGVS